MLRVDTKSRKFPVAIAQGTLHDKAPGGNRSQRGNLFRKQHGVTEGQQIERAGRCIVPFCQRPDDCLHPDLAGRARLWPLDRLPLGDGDADAHGFPVKREWLRLWSSPPYV